MLPCFVLNRSHRFNHVNAVVSSVCFTLSAMDIRTCIHSLLCSVEEFFMCRYMYMYVYMYMYIIL